MNFDLQYNQHLGECKGFAELDSTGALLNGFNVESVIFNGPGDYSVKWTVPLAAGFYHPYVVNARSDQAVTCTVAQTGTSNEVARILCFSTNNNELFNVDGCFVAAYGWH